MSSGWRRGLSVLLLLALAGWVYAPILGSGPLGPDHEVLVGASRIAFPELGGASSGWRALFVAPGTEGRPLAALSLAADARLWTRAGSWAGVDLLGLRALNLALLVLTALVLWRFVLRFLLPWTGSEGARAAGCAASALLLFYPTSVPAVASPGARALLLGSLLGCAAALAFLRGRQERRYSLVLLAGLLTIASALASEVAFLVPPGLAITEYVSAHRYRPHTRRARTSLTTLLAFGACALVDALARALVREEPWPRELAHSLASFGGLESGLLSLLVSLERLGFCMLPVNASSRGATGYILAVAMLLVALQPALRAARSAPRLWAGVLASWAVLVIVAVIYRADRRVHPTDLAHAASLWPATIVMAAGLGVAATALTGRRRLFVPASVVFLASLLARSDARCIADAAAASATLRAELREARAELGEERKILVLDPPRTVAGHPASVARLEWMIDPAFGGGGPPAERLWARGIDAAGFRVLARQPELALLREEGLIALFHPALVEELPVPDDAPPLHVLVPPPRPMGGPRVWREEGRSPALDLGPLGVQAVRAIARPATRTTDRPLLSWESASSLLSSGRREGVWLAGDEGPVAHFDLARSYRWLLCERVKRIWFDGELALLAQAQALEQAPELVRGARFEARRGDWVLRPDWASVPSLRQGEPRFFLELLDLDSLAYLEVEGRRVGDELVFEEAEDFASGRWREGGALAWSLELRVGDTAVARSGGR